MLCSHTPKAGSSEDKQDRLPEDGLKTGLKMALSGMELHI